jgi:hypothetical protein
LGTDGFLVCLSPQIGPNGATSVCKARSAFDTCQLQRVSGHSPCPAMRESPWLGASSPSWLIPLASFLRLGRRTSHPSVPKCQLQAESTRLDNAMRSGLIYGARAPATPSLKIDRWALLFNGRGWAVNNLQAWRGRALSGGVWEEEFGLVVWVADSAPLFVVGRMSTGQRTIKLRNGNPIVFLQPAPALCRMWICSVQPMCGKGWWTNHRQGCCVL